MSSIVLGWSTIKEYLATVGPKVGRPPRPRSCPRCDADRIWFDGWRLVYCVVLDDGTPHRFADGLPIQRVTCAHCDVSWPLRPAFLYPHRSFAPDVTEAAAVAYLCVPEATYDAVAERVGCAPRSVWRWVSSIAPLVEPAVLVAAIARVDADTPAAGLLPRAVPDDHEKARSTARRATLLRAYQVLVALALYARVQRHPPDDPSPLRWLLVHRWVAFRQRAIVSRPGFSPPTPEVLHGPSG